MNLSLLLDGFRKDSRIEQLAAGVLLPQPARVFLHNLQGSSAEFVFSAVFTHDYTASANHLIIVNDVKKPPF
jgi:transcription-repair coupling factor (superfamily II helicase)